MGRGVVFFALEAAAPGWGFRELQPPLQYMWWVMSLKTCIE